MTLRLPASVALASMAVIAFQLSLMQVLSMVQWHHFASLIIAIALLGCGTAGTIITLMRYLLMKHFEGLLPLFMFLCAATMAIAVWVAQAGPIRFDSFLLFAESHHVWRLVWTCLIYFTPFFMGSMAIGLSFARFHESIGRLYCANLVGSGLGGILALGLMRFFTPPAIPAVIAVLPLAAGLLMCGSRLLAASACVPAVVIGLIVCHPPGLNLSEFKSLKRTLEIPGSMIIQTQNSPYGLMQIVSSPSLRYAPGLSLNYTGDIPVFPGVFRDGEWFGPLLEPESGEKKNILDFTTRALPYAFKKRSRVLVLDAETGTDIIQAVSHGANLIDAAEPNPFAISLLENQFSGVSGIRFNILNSRTFLMSGTGRYDLIALPTVDSFGGTSGLNALAENYLLTREAAALMLNRLDHDGVISVSIWHDYPPRNTLKLLATFADALWQRGDDPRMHIAAVRNWNILTLVVKNAPITADESSLIRGFCDRMSFDVTLLPGTRADERVRFNALYDSQWLTDLDMLLSPAGNMLISNYDFNIRPATDDRPYFSQFLTIKSLSRLKAVYGQRSVPFFEIGYMILVLGLAQLSVLAILLILLPLIRIGWRGKGRPAVIIYFGGIAVGYMFIEIVFIQKFILYFGSPIYTAAAVICAMLVCSGAGSAFSARIPRRFIFPLFFSTVVLIATYAFVLGPLLRVTLPVSLPVKAVLATVFIAPIAFCLGMAFPLGISRLSEEAVPWAWGINGCLSVVSSVSATIAAVELGFTWVMAIAALAYGIAFTSDNGLYLKEKV